MAVHVFCGRMDNYIRAKFNGTAKYGSGKGIVNKKRQTVAVGKTGKSFDVQNAERGVGQCFAKTSFVFGRMASAIRSLLSFWSTKVVSMPKRRNIE